MWQHWINGLLGIALVVLAFMATLTTSMAWTIGIMGAVIAVLGFWGAVASTSGVQAPKVA